MFLILLSKLNWKMREVPNGSQQFLFRSPPFHPIDFVRLVARVLMLSKAAPEREVSVLLLALIPTQYACY